jgi:trimeric autotransporter adhesin
MIFDQLRMRRGVTPSVFLLTVGQLICSSLCEVMSESFARSLRDSSAAPPPSALRAGGKKRKSVRFSEDAECSENDAGAASSSNTDAVAARNAEKGICLSGAPPRQRQALSNTSNVQAAAPGMQNCAESKADAANQQARSKNRGIGGGAVRIRTPSKVKRPRVEEHHYYQAPQPLQPIALPQQQTSSAAAAAYMAASAAALTSALRAGSTPAPVAAARPVLPLSAPALTLSAMPSTPLSQRRLLGPAGLGGVSAFSRAASALATVAESPHSESLPEDNAQHSSDSSTSVSAAESNNLQLAATVQHQQQQQPSAVDSALVEQLRATLAAVGEQGRCLSAMVTDLQAGAVVPRHADVSTHVSQARNASTVVAATGGTVCTCGGTKAVGETVGPTVEDEHSPLRERLEELQSKVKY